MFLFAIVIFVMLYFENICNGGKLVDSICIRAVAVDGVVVHMVILVIVGGRDSLAIDCRGA